MTVTNKKRTAKAIDVTRHMLPSESKAIILDCGDGFGILRLRENKDKGEWVKIR